MKLIKSFSIYAGTTIFNKGIGFLLLPIFTYYFTPKDYGTLALINTLVAMITPFILLQVKGAISVDYYKRDNKQEFNDFFVSALTNPLISFGIVLALFVISSKYLAAWLDIDQFWIIIIPFLALFSMIPQVSQTIFQVSERPIPFGIFSLSRTGLELGLSIILVVVVGLNYEGRLYGTLVASILFSIVGFIILYKQSLFKGSIKRIFQKDALLFGLPLIPHAIGAIAINSSDRLFIAKMVSIEELGIYSIGYAIGSIILIIEHAFTQAWTPFLFKNLKEDSPSSKNKVVKMSYYFMLFLLICAISLTLITPFLFKYVLAQDFSGGAVYVFWVALGYVFSGFYKMMTGYILFLKKTKYLGYLSFFSVIINVGLNYVLILNYGALGAAYATSISFFILFIVTTFISYQIYPMPWLNILKK